LGGEGNGAPGRNGPGDSPVVMASDDVVRLAERELDEEVLRAVQAGEPGAFDRFVARFGDRVYGFGMRMCGRQEDAEDVFQEALLTVYQRIRDLRHPGALRTWLFRVVSNHCRSAHRRVREKPLPETLDLDALLPGEGPMYAGPFLPESGDPEQEVVRRELGEALETAVAKLPPDYRLVWMLRDVEGLDTRETAEALGIQEGNVKMRLHRARLALRKELAHLAPGSALAADGSGGGPRASGTGEGTGDGSGGRPGTGSGSGLGREVES
jgi:RNA polymerase sigma-70 factor (ECF subfamily)